MKNLLFLLFACLLFQSCKKETDTEMMSPKFKLRGKIYNNSTYCGGASASEELLNYLAKERPSANCKFYIRKGNINKPGEEIYKVIQTDSNGYFMTELPKGKYIAITAEKFNAESLPKMADCEWLRKQDFKIIVTGEDLNFNLSFTNECNPCLGSSN
ncbi:MAG: hypothetical protein IPJ22_13210 [Bacteroidetes bacterium]|nr:hypothetical protein [Bacteroidota bacterium]